MASASQVGMFLALVMSCDTSTYPDKLGLNVTYAVRTCDAPLAVRMAAQETPKVKPKSKVKTKYKKRKKKTRKRRHKR